MSPVPSLRVQRANDAPLREKGRYVLYWMIAARRPAWSYALDHALDACESLGRPLLVLEALRCDYPYASDRLHRFVLDGMRANQAAFRDAGVRYLPYVEPRPGAGRGLLARLAEDAALVVTDRYPVFFLPHMVEKAARSLEVALDVVDSCGLLPLQASEKEAPTAYVFRRFLQKQLPDHLEAPPRARPFAGRSLPATPASVPRDVLDRWPEAPRALLEGRPGALDELPIDHDVPPVDEEGGSRAAQKRLAHFLSKRLAHYDEERNQPEAHATSELSAYLHFGHLSAHEVFARIARAEKWTPDHLSPRADGRREGWWGLPAGVEAFLDQLVTWRELGYHFAAHRPDADCFEANPAWARATLAEHAKDARAHVYDRGTFERAETHDPLWNAAQRQLRREGRIHNYLRMLWGKKVLEWTAGPDEAWEVLRALNDRWATDGRDPNSYSGIGWVLGRFDRPWAPEREIFGRVRYMSSANTARKLRVGGYLATFGPTPGQSSLPGIG